MVVLIPVVLNKWDASVLIYVVVRVLCVCMRLWFAVFLLDARHWGASAYCVSRRPSLVGGSVFFCVPFLGGAVCPVALVDALLAFVCWGHAHGAPLLAGVVCARDVSPGFALL